jgi:ESCRT-II complex subunit VPS25
MWRTPEEWGNLIWKWAMDNGFTNTVCTLYELHSGEDTKQQEFYGMETWLLKRSVASLQAKGKAEYIRGLAPDDSDSGVKFFA